MSIDHHICRILLHLTLALEPEPEPKPKLFWRACDLVGVCYHESRLALKSVGKWRIGACLWGQGQRWSGSKRSIVLYHPYPIDVACVS